MGFNYWPLRSVSFSAGKAEKLKKYVINNNVTCAYGGEPYGTDNRISYEHIVPRSEGGERLLSNLLIVCQPCNTARDTFPPKEFLKKPNVQKNLINYLVQMQNCLIYGTSYIQEVVPTLAEQLGIKRKDLTSAIKNNDSNFYIAA